MVTKFAERCTGIGKLPIVDKDECMRASTSLTLNFDDEVNDTRYPKGCIFQGIIDATVMWNINKTRQTQEEAGAEICRQTGNKL